MIRLFVSNGLQQNKPLSLSESHVHYLRNVMRRQVGDSILLFNGRNGEWQSTIQSLEKKSGICLPHTQTRKQNIPKKRFLCPALIKKENMDFVFQKATELGVSDIFPLISERTVVSKLNLERAKSLVIEASEQSERLTIPTVYPPQKIIEILGKLPKDITPVCLAERGTTTNPLSKDKTYAFFIGPEGGWTPNELSVFEQNHVQFWHLGTTILRAETASIAALSCAVFCLD